MTPVPSEKHNDFFFELLTNEFRCEFPLPIYPDDANMDLRLRGYQTKDHLVCPLYRPFLKLYLPQNYEHKFSPTDLYILSMFHKVNLREFDSLPEKHQKSELKKGRYGVRKAKYQRRLFFNKCRNFFRRFCIKDDSNEGILILYLDQFAHRKNINEMLDFLIDRKDVNINSIDEYNKTPLMKLCEGKFDSNLALKIIDRGADIQAYDKYNFTALHYAVLTQKVDVVKKLLKNGANVMAKNCFNHSPLFLATYDSDKINFEIVSSLMNSLPLDVPTIITYTQSCPHGVFMSPIDCIIDRDSKVYFEVCFAYNCMHTQADHGKNWNLDFFQFIWSIPNLNYPRSDFKVFDYFINLKPGNPHDYHKILKIVLASTIGSILLNEYFANFLNVYRYPVNFLMFYNWYQYFALDERLEFMKWWYSVGGVVDVKDINYMFERLGFNEEVLLLLKLMDPSFKSSTSFEFFLFNLFCGKEFTINLENLNSKILGYSTYEVSLNCLIFLIDHFTIPIEYRVKFKWENYVAKTDNKKVKELIMSASVASSVPPLMELSRNIVRINIREQCPLPYHLHFENMVDDLNIPRAVKNYILLLS